MNTDILRTELKKTVYSTMSDQSASDKLNAVTLSVPDNTHRTDLYILDKLGVTMGEAVLTAFASVASTREAFSVAHARLRRGGIDFSNQGTVAMISALVTNGVLTQAQGTTLKNLGKKKASRASQLGLGEVKPGHVQEARK